MPAASERVLQHSTEALLLAFIPNNFALYGSLPRHLRETMRYVVGYAGFTGECMASCRTLAAAIGIGKSSVSRHLSQLVGAGVLTRHRRPGGCYSYSVDARFLPQSAGLSQPPGALSRPRAAPVPPARTDIKPLTKRAETHRELPDDAAQWEPRLRSWQRSGGRFWPVFAGPRPDEPGCFAPPDMIAAAIAAVRTG